MPLDSVTRMDMQSDLSIQTDPAQPDYGKVFTDTELDRLWDRAAAYQNRSVYAQAIVFAIRQLWMGSVKFNKYTVGQTSEQKSEITAQLKQALDYWELKINEANQVQIVGMRLTPPRRVARTYQQRFGAQNGYTYGNGIDDDRYCDRGEFLP